MKLFMVAIVGSITDDAIATTEAICEKIEADIAEILVTEPDVRDGRWLQNNSTLDIDTFVPTTAELQID